MILSSPSRSLQFLLWELVKIREISVFSSSVAAFRSVSLRVKPLFGRGSAALWSTRKAFWSLLQRQKLQHLDFFPEHQPNDILVELNIQRRALLEVFPHLAAGRRIN